MAEDGFEAIIFDMDGVLVDSEHLIKECETEVLEEEGVEVTEEDIEAHEGMATKEYFQKMLKEKKDERYTDEELDQLTEEMERRKLDLYFQNMEDIKVIEGSADTVEELSSDYKVAVASNSEREMVREVVNHLDIGEYLETYASFTDVENGKPEPDVFHYAADEMNVEPEEAIVLEDSEAGTKAAVKGGFHTYRFRRPPIEGVEARVDSMEEFREVIERL